MEKDLARENREAELRGGADTQVSGHRMGLHQEGR